MIFKQCLFLRKSTRWERKKCIHFIYLFLLLKVLHRVETAVRTGVLAFWGVFALVQSTSPDGAASTMNVSGNHLTLTHTHTQLRFVIPWHMKSNSSACLLTGTVELFLMENGFKKAAHTADVDMECCTASLRSSIMTAVSTMIALISLYLGVVVLGTIPQSKPT